jgi:hypothetical protein
MSGKTSLLAVAVHAVVFYLVAVYVLPELTSRQVLGSEGFKGTPAKKKSGDSCSNNNECASNNCKSFSTGKGFTNRCA